MLSLRTPTIRQCDRLLANMDSTRKFGWVVGLAVMAISLVPKFIYSLPGDSAVYVYLAGRMLDGERYLNDFFEYNTPFAIGFYTLPLAMGRLLGMGDVLAAKLFVCAIIIASVWCVHRVILQSREWQNVTRYNAIIITLFVLLNFRTNFYYNELVTKSMAFLVCVMPYLFSLQVRMEDGNIARRMQWVLGFLQGMAVLFKPNYVLFFVITELYVAWHKRSLGALFVISNWVGAGVVILGYGVMLPFFFPEYLTLAPYFLVLYSADVRSLISWVDNALTIVIFSLPLIVWGAALGPQIRERMQVGILMIGTVASAVVICSEVLLSYDQKSVFATFVALPLLYSLLVLLRAFPVVNKLSQLMAVLAVMIACIGLIDVTKLVSAYLPHTPHREVALKQIKDYIGRYAPDAPVYTLSDNTEHFVLPMISVRKQPYPVLHSHRMLLDMADGKTVFAGAGQESRKDAYEYILRSITHFFREHLPVLVFVSDKTTSGEPRYCMPMVLDIALDMNAEFAAIWRTEYRKIGTIVAIEEPEWLATRGPRTQMLDFGTIKRNVIFPPVAPVRTRLDVYRRITNP